MPDYFLLTLVNKSDMVVVGTVLIPGTTLADVAAVEELALFHIVARPLETVHPIPPSIIGFVADANVIGERMAAWIGKHHAQRKPKLRRLPGDTSNRCFEHNGAGFSEIPLEGSPFEAHVKAARAEHSAKVQADNRSPQMAERAAHRKLSPQVAAMHARRPGRR